MKKGTKIEYASVGYYANGKPVHNEYGVENLKFIQFISVDKQVKIISTDKNNVIKVVDAENCKLIDSVEQAILGYY